MPNSEMDNLELVIALVRHVDKQIRWLAIHNPVLKQLEFVASERLEGEAEREVVRREVSWALGLDRNQDFAVSNMAQLNLELDDPFWTQTGASRCRISFHNVELYRSAVIRQLTFDSRFVWLTSTEICEGRSQNGIMIDPKFVLLNERANVIQSWESNSL